MIDTDVETQYHARSWRTALSFLPDRVSDFFTASHGTPEDILFFISQSMP